MGRILEIFAAHTGRVLFVLVALVAAAGMLSLRPSNSSVGDPGPGILFLLLLPVTGLVGLMWLLSSLSHKAIQNMPPPASQGGTDPQGWLIDPDRETV